MGWVNNILSAEITTGGQDAGYLSHRQILKLLVRGGEQIVVVMPGGGEVGAVYIPDALLAEPPPPVDPALCDAPMLSSLPASGNGEVDS
jgi:hypothetical protein